MVLERNCRHLHCGSSMVRLVRPSMEMVRRPFQAMAAGAGAPIALSVFTMSAPARFLSGPT